MNIDESESHVLIRLLFRTQINTEPYETVPNQHIGSVLHPIGNVTHRMSPTNTQSNSNRFDTNRQTTDTMWKQSLNNCYLNWAIATGFWLSIRHTFAKCSRYSYDRYRTTASRRTERAGQYVKPSPTRQTDLLYRFGIAGSFRRDLPWSRTGPTGYFQQTEWSTSQYNSPRRGIC